MSDWPLKVCNTADHPGVFTAGHVDPSKIASTGTKCIYVNDTTFTNYPANSSAALDVRLQPVKTFDASSTHPLP